jgi:hypothetical protein
MNRRGHRGMGGGHACAAWVRGRGLIRHTRDLRPRGRRSHGGVHDRAALGLEFRRGGGGWPFAIVRCTGREASVTVANTAVMRRS